VVGTGRGGVEEFPALDLVQIISASPSDDTKECGNLASPCSQDMSLVSCGCGSCATL